MALLLTTRLPAQGAADQVWIGVSIEEQDEAIVVTEVVPGSPGDKGGLKVGDRIEKIANRAFKDIDACIEFVLSMTPGSTQAFQVRRGDKSLRLRVKLGSRADRDRAAKGEAAAPERPEATDAPKPKGRLGVVLEEAGDQVRIASVDDDSPAAKAGFHEGDVLHKVGDKPVTDVDMLAAAIAGAGPGRKLPIEVLRDGKPVVLEPVLGAADQPARPGGAGAGPASQPSQEARVERPTPPVFGGDVGAALAKAGAEHKLVLVAFVDPESSACKQMKESLGDERVRKALGAYVVVDVDVVEKAAVADRFGVLATPHFIVLDPDGKALGKFTGYLAPATLAGRLGRYVEDRRKEAAAAAAAEAKPTDRPASRTTDRAQAAPADRPQGQQAGAAELRRRMQELDRARKAFEDAAKRLDEVRRENEALRKRLEALEEALRKLQERK